MRCCKRAVACRTPAAATVPSSPFHKTEPRSPQNAKHIYAFVARVGRKHRSALNTFTSFPSPLSRYVFHSLSLHKKYLPTSQMQSIIQNGPINSKPSTELSINRIKTFQLRSFFRQTNNATLLSGIKYFIG